MVSRHGTYVKQSNRCHMEPYMSGCSRWCLPPMWIGGNCTPGSNLTFFFMKQKWSRSETRLAIECSEVIDIYVHSTKKLHSGHWISCLSLNISAFSNTSSTPVRGQFHQKMNLQLLPTQNKHNTVSPTGPTGPCHPPSQALSRHRMGIFDSTSSQSTCTRQVLPLSIPPGVTWPFFFKMRRWDGKFADMVFPLGFRSLEKMMRRRMMMMMMMMMMMNDVYILLWFHHQPFQFSGIAL